MDNVIDITELPIWTPWVMTEVQHRDCLPMGQAIKVGIQMTKRQAWGVARAEMEKRPNAVAMAVRRDSEQV
ncbi:MAG: hypothetical protein EKK46_15100 [Rhodocyclaceae bacterium]|nr:MAG: hypothetical protein EKK46_15100 [Rhodocyclaceae bacterium]